MSRCRILVIGCIFGLIPCHHVFAQEQPPVVESLQPQALVISAQDDGQGGPPRIMSFSTSGGPLPVLSAVPGFGFGGANANVSNLMMNPQFQRELELVDDQMEDIRRIQQELQESIAAEMKEARQPNGSFDPARMRDMGFKMQALREDADKQVNEVLLPHQKDRLKQVRRQLRMRDQGDANALTSGELAKELGLTDAQIDRLKRRATQLEKELQEEIARLKAESKEKLLKELTKDQRKKLKELVGTEFKVERPRFQRIVRPGSSSGGNASNGGNGSDTPRN